MAEARWKRMMFKGCKVYAQVDESGHLLTRGSRVTIKYQLHQDQEYQAGADAVQEIDEDRLEKGNKGNKKRKTKPHNSEVPSRLPKDAKEDSIIIYSDGACKGNPGPAGIGIVFLYKSHQKEISRFIGQATNNIAELRAIKVALREVKDPLLPIYLHTDSAYCYGLLAEGWKPRQNKELVEDIKKEMARFPRLSIIKIEGHAGIEKNERADQLAREAITNRTI